MIVLGTQQTLETLKKNKLAKESELFDKSTVSILSNIFTCPIFGQYGHAEASVFPLYTSNKLEYYCSPNIVILKFWVKMENM